MGMWGWLSPEDVEPIGEQFGERLGGPYWITGLTPEVREVVTCRQRVWMVRPRHD